MDDAADRAAGASTRGSASRSALAMGMVGALGEELLSALVASSDYATVHVAVTQPIGTATARLSPWVVGHGTVAVDDAYICIASPETLVPKGSPMQRVDAAHALEAARIARACGATRLALVSPLSALLQLNAAAHTLGSEAEVELSAFGFDTVLIVRPTAASNPPASGWAVGAVRALTRMVLEIMLPASVQPLRARTAAMAILEAVRRAPRGVQVLGARELAAIVEETMPDALPRRMRLR